MDDNLTSTSNQSDLSTQGPVSPLDTDLSDQSSITSQEPEPSIAPPGTDLPTQDNSSTIGGLGTPPPLDNSDIEKPEISNTSDSDISSSIASDSSVLTTLSASPSTSDNSSLDDIKTQALTQLTPMLKDLDQTPEERFKTTMMMIQASDNKDLIKDAYAAAQQISDEKVKAQALLDIVNEINYFSQAS